MSKVVGILTTFADLKPEYSLVNVVLQQLEILHRFDYKPVLFTLPHFVGELPDYVEVRKVVPQWLLEPYKTGQPVPEDFEDNVAETAKVYEKEFADLDCLIAHDICFINSYLIYNVALKKADLKGLPIFSQMHSGSSTRLMQLGYPWDELWKLPKNTKLIYMNHTEIVAAAEHYGIWPKDVRIIYNPMDLRHLLKLSPLTCELIETYGLFEADIICVYPVSSTRMGDDGKAVRKVISVMGHLKMLGQSVRLVIPNAHANADKEKQTIRNFQRIAAEQGLSPAEVIFTSFHTPPKWENGFPHENVRELFQISDLFIFPTWSENGPLILLEAAATKNLLLLNSDFEPLQEFLGVDASLNFGFTSRLTPNRIYGEGGEERYYEGIAKVVLSDLNSNRVSKAFRAVRKKFSYEAVGRQLIPALEESINERVSSKL